MFFQTNDQPCFDRLVFQTIKPFVEFGQALDLYHG